MKEFIIEENEAGQRFDKYLAKLLREAPKSFFYKMLRKKNITLNGKKATGNEKLLKGDTIKLFLSDETFDKFAGSSQAARAYCELDIVYEDPDIIIINKPAGMLSQPAYDGEPSLVETADRQGFYLHRPFRWYSVKSVTYRRSEGFDLFFCKITFL